MHMFLFFYLSWHQIGAFGVEEVKAVTEGDSVTLNSGVTEINDGDDIQWTFGVEKLQIKIKIKSKQRYDGPDGRFRHRLQLDEHTGSLTITNTTTQHTGRYQLDISGTRIKTKTFRVLVNARLPVPVMIRNSSQCSSSCSVLCSVVNVSHVTLSWLKGHSLLSSISVSDLSISLSLPLEVEDQDTNNYSCVLNNSITHRTTHLDISAVCHTCADSVSPIILISVSAVAGSLLIVAPIVIFFICRRLSNNDQEVETVESRAADGITYADPTFYKRQAQNSNTKDEDSVEYVPISIR